MKTCRTDIAPSAKKTVKLRSNEEPNFGLAVKIRSSSNLKSN